MSNIDILSMAIRNLFKRKMRTFLTVLGVIIGSTAIIIMISIGIGVNLSFEEQAKSMPDATVVQVYNWSVYQGYVKGGAVLDDKTIAEISKIDGVEIITPYIDTYIYALSGRYGTQFSVIGMDVNALEAFGYTLTSGEYLSPDDEFGVLFGSDVAAQFKTEKERNRYNWRGIKSSQEQKLNVDPLKDKFKFSPDWNLLQPPQTNTGSENNYDEDYVSDESTTPVVQPFKPYNVHGVGILDGSTKYEASSSCIMNVKTVIKMLDEYTKWQNKAYGNRNTQETQGYPQALIKCNSINVVSAVAEAVGEYGFEYVSNPTETIDRLKSMMNTLQNMLMAIGAVSLFVAAIGIANTMVMSIYERTKEIGVMKVIGASLKDIKKLFLIEAALIGLMGGFLGIAVSFLVSYIMNNMDISLFSEIMIGMPETDLSVIPTWLALMALIFSAIIGLMSGYFPARRATKLSALSAIQNN